MEDELVLIPETLKNAEDEGGLEPKQSVDSEALVTDTYGPFVSAPHSSPVQNHTKVHAGRQKTADIEDEHSAAGVVGLHNEGNTCFMNAGLQCLFTNPWLVRHFLNNDLTTAGASDGMLIDVFGQLLRKVWSGHYSVLTAAHFKDALADLHPQFRDFRQHDSQEFLALLLDSLHELLIKCEHMSPCESFASSSTMTECISSSQSSKPCISTLAASPADLSSDADTMCSSASSEMGLTMTAPVCQVEFTESSSASERSMPRSPSILCNMVPKQHSSIRDRKEWDIQRDFTEEESMSCGLPDIQQQLQLTCDTEDSSKSYARTHAEANSDSLVSPRPLVKKLRLDIRATNASQNEEFNDGIAQQWKGGSNTSADDSKRLPSFEDLCMKDTKTKNINVAMGEEEDAEIADGMAVDSDKFRKQENASVAKELEKIEYLQELLDYDSAKMTAYRPKETNLLANVKPKFADGKDIAAECCSAELADTGRAADVLPCDATMANNAWRAGEEKNILWETRVKMNTCRNPVKQPALSVAEDEQQHTLLNNQRPAAAVADVCTLPLNNRCSAEPSKASMPGAVATGDGDSCSQQAECTWLSYIRNNRTVVSETFHGLFQSTVTCSTCNHVSVTFEPFMYLSVPLPRALEKQIEVTFVPYGYTHTAERRLVCAHMQDSVRQLKAAIVNQYSLSSTTDIVLAETFECHVSKILDDEQLVKDINDDSRLLYALEVVREPSNCNQAVEETSTSPITEQQQKEAACKELQHDVATTGAGCISKPAPTEDDAGGSSFSTMEYNMEIDERDSNFWQAVNDVDAMCQQPTNDVSSTERHLPDNTAVGTGTNSSEEVSDIICLDDSQSAVNSKHVASGLDAIGCAVDWKTCQICLETLSDIELKMHSACKATICYNCEESYLGICGSDGFKCPVCMQPLAPGELVTLDSDCVIKPVIRMMLVPIVFRRESGDSGQLSVFGHPQVVYVASVLTGAQLYTAVEGVVSFLGDNFTLFLTGGQGLHCSRCLFTEHCSGCVVMRDSTNLCLSSSDTLAVHFASLAPQQLHLSSALNEHPSLAEARHPKTLTLEECLRLFAESETLDEQNHWYCPTCCKNCTAKKTLTICKYPPTLIIYLKRFIYHGLSSTKVDTPVTFPLENLDLADYMAGPVMGDQVTYDLQSCVCHFGSGTSSGHYTAYTRQPLSGLWSYHNDETTFEKTPGGSDSSHAYILFYQRQGDNVNFSLPAMPGSSSHTPAAGMHSCLSWPLFPVSSEANCIELQNNVADSASHSQFDFYE